MINANTIGEFTWDFGQEFFIETDVGNFVYSDPDYNGDNTVKETGQTYSEWIAPQYGRDKGKTFVGSRCTGARVIMLDGTEYEI